MNISPKERFLDICHFKRPGDLCMLSTGIINAPWGGVVEEWIEQGAPKEIINPRFRREYFQYQPINDIAPETFNIAADLYDQDTKLRPEIDLGHGLPIAHEGGGILNPVWLVPGYEFRFISEDERTVTVRSARGRTLRFVKNLKSQMAQFLDWPVKDRATWNEYKKRLDPNSPERWPSDWGAYVQKMNAKSEPLSLGLTGFYQTLRLAVGSEKLLYMFYDDPGLIEDMMEQVLYMMTVYIKRVLKDIKVEQAHWGEDMAYDAGPLISPAMVRKFMMPRYRKATDLLRSYGVDINYMDCDGNLNELIPLWLEVGINFVWPLEVAAHNDAVALRKKYGKDLILKGNIDKRALIKGKEATREEVMSKVPFLLEQGGYFPHVDHLVPPDVPFENYCYYINLIREVAGREKLSFQ